MKKLTNTAYFLFLILLMQFSCKMQDNKVSPEDIAAMNLKRGEIVSCGPSDKQFGILSFDNSCPQKVKKDFNLAVALLHSFEYDEAERVFAKIIDEEPGCAMAYWGIAMCNFHPLWTPSTPEELNKGSKAIKIARSLVQKSEMESDYIEAVALYYKNGNEVDHHTRCVYFKEGMEKMYKKFPNEKEAAIFYALGLAAAADPADKSFENQIKAGKILNTIYADEPNHPGIIHYIIHAYDYPGIAELALPAAMRYASVAPASAHAQHMPSHIFTRLGLWDESIRSNLVSISSARCYAQNFPRKGHWDEELHGMDYLVYAYLQKAEDGLAKEQVDYLKTIREVFPVNFKVAYAFAAIPARYLLEKRMWKDAAVLQIYPAQFPWQMYPWQKAIFHFTRLLGLVHTGSLDSAGIELDTLKVLHDMLAIQKDLYKAERVEIQIKISEAWILYKKAKYGKALDLMGSAADLEDATQKHPVTPGEIIPARELLGDMLMQMGYYEKALEMYQEDLKTNPNRLNGLYGAGLAAEKAGDNRKAVYYYDQLSKVVSANSIRPELVAARQMLNK